MLKWYKIYSNEGSVLQKLRTTVARNRTGVGGSAGAAGSAPAAAGEQGKLPGAESREAAHSRRCRRGEVLIANAVRIAAMYRPGAERDSLARFSALGRTVARVNTRSPPVQLYASSGRDQAWWGSRGSRAKRPQGSI